MNSTPIFDLIYYYARIGLWKHLQHACTQELKKGADPFITFWKCLGVAKEGSSTEAINEIEPLFNRKDIQYAASYALIYYHSMCIVKDNDAIKAISQQLSVFEKTANEMSMYTASMFCIIVGDDKKALKIINKLLERNKEYGPAYQILGWINLIRPADEFLSPIPEIEEEFKNSLKSEPNNITTKLGLALYYSYIKEYNKANATLSEITVSFKAFIPGHIEMAKLHTYNHEWEQALESIKTVYNLDNLNIEALQLHIFITLVYTSNQAEALDKLKDLVRSIEVNEPKNAELFFKVAQLFSRCCGSGKEELLRITMELLKKSQSLDSSSSSYVSELAYQHSLLGEYSIAFTLYQKAASLNESDIVPIYGMIYCRLKQNLFEDVEGQLEFLKEMCGESKQSLHLFLEALLLQKKLNETDQSLEKLIECLRKHTMEIKSENVSMEYYVIFNPQFITELCTEYILHCDPKNKESRQFVHLEKIVNYLDNVTKQLPGLLEPYLLLSKARYILKDITGSLGAINACLLINPESEYANMMSAILHIEVGNFSAAAAALEQALSQNFKVRQNPLFVLLQSKVDIKREDYKQALTILEPVLDHPAVKEKVTPEVSQRISRGVMSYGEEERAGIYIQIIECLVHLKRYDQAKQYLQKAIAQFSGTPYEVVIIMANSELSLRTGDMKKALNMLKKIQPDSKQFKAAKLKMAEIYLTHLMDRRHYKKCYLDLIEADAQPENYKLAAQAMIKIQEPDEAIQLYQKASEQFQDMNLVKNIGRAYIMTHNYARAKEYYIDALRQNPSLANLRVDLSDLLRKLNYFEDAKKIIEEGLQLLQGADDSKTLKHKAELYAMSAKIIIEESNQMDRPDVEIAKTLYSKAIIFQKQLLQSLKGFMAKLEKAKGFCASILYNLAKYFINYENNSKDALEHYKDASNFATENSTLYNLILIDMAKLQMNEGAYDDCKQTCERILKYQPCHEGALHINSTVLVILGKIDEAVAIYAKAIQEKPRNYELLCSLITLLRRAGKEELIGQYITNSSKGINKHSNPGLAFCRALYNKYLLNIGEAIKEFNSIRKDEEYGKRSLIEMINLCLNPENDMFWVTEESTQINVSASNLSAATTFFQEFESKSSGEPMVDIMRAYIAIYSNNKTKMDEAQTWLAKLLNSHKDYIPGLLCMGVIKMLQKKISEAKNFFKSITSKMYQPEFADQFEQAWLISAKLNFNSNKLDIASQFCEKCITYNKAHIKAQEMLGMIMEKQKNLDGASNHYEMAWKISNNSSSSIGFRLATNHFNSRSYVNCINICNQLLRKFPTFEEAKKMQSKAESLLKSD